jgi:CHAD domain-containing protein
VLGVYRRLLDRGVTDPLRDELKWLGRKLSPARDLEVLEERLGEALDDLPPELVVGPVRARLTRHFSPERAAARKRVERTLRGKRYLRLLDALDRLVTDPPLRGRASRRAKKELPRHLRRAHRKVSRRVAAADGDSGLLHSARKAAKQLRYGAEVAEPVVGKRIRKRAKAMTKVLGEHQDSVVARPVIRELGMTAHLAGENGFTYGLLHAREQRVAAEAVDQFTRKTWPRLA